MAIIEIDAAKRRYPSLDCETCDDPRHSCDDDTAVAVVETPHDAYPVCECCLARILDA